MNGNRTSDPVLLSELRSFGRKSELVGKPELKRQFSTMIDCMSTGVAYWKLHPTGEGVEYPGPVANCFSSLDLAGYPVSLTSKETCSILASHSGILTVSHEVFGAISNVYRDFRFDLNCYLTKINGCLGRIFLVGRYLWYNLCTTIRRRMSR